MNLVIRLDGIRCLMAPLQVDTQNTWEIVTSVMGFSDGEFEAILKRKMEKHCYDGDYDV